MRTLRFQEIEIALSVSLLAFFEDLKSLQSSSRKLTFSFLPPLAGFEPVTDSLITSCCLQEFCVTCIEDLHAANPDDPEADPNEKSCPTCRGKLTGESSVFLPSLLSLFPKLRSSSSFSSHQPPLSSSPWRKCFALQPRCLFAISSTELVFVLLILVASRRSPRSPTTSSLDLRSRISKRTRIFPSLQ